MDLRTLSDEELRRQSATYVGTPDYVFALLNEVFTRWKASTKERHYNDMTSECQDSYDRGYEDAKAVYE